MISEKKNNKNARGSAAQFFVAGELCRRNLVAVVTMGNTPNIEASKSELRRMCEPTTRLKAAYRR